MNTGRTHFKKGNHPKTEFKKGFKHTEEWKQKAKKRMLGKTYALGYKHTPEEIEKIRDAVNKKVKERTHNFFKTGISRNQMLVIKAGREKPKQCDICGSMGRICYDHDHETGKFRGWICHRCNATLGFVKDNVETLEAMIKYLLKNV